MKYYLVFLLLMNDGYKQWDMTGIEFKNKHECQLFAVHESRTYILENYKGKGIRQVIPACLSKTRAARLNLLSQKGI